MSTQTEAQRAIPEGTAWVVVLNSSGKQEYKEPHNVTPEDKLLRKKDGTVITARSKPGRPVVRPGISIEQTGKIDDFLTRVKQDPLLRQIKAQFKESPTMENRVLVALAEEQAKIKVAIEDRVSKGADTSQASVKRAGLLKQIYKLMTEGKSSNSGLDLESDAFKFVFNEILDNFKEALHLLKYKDEQIEGVFAQAASLFNDDWKSNIAKKLKAM